MNRLQRTLIAIQNETTTVHKTFENLKTNAMSETKLIYPFDFNSIIENNYNVEMCTNFNKTDINIEVCDIVDACKKYKHDKTCVINFASFEKAGGGYLSGAQAQEESLCRASTLYSCLKDNKVYELCNINYGLYENYIVYSPRVPFFRDSYGNLLDDVFTMSVFSATAVNRTLCKSIGLSDNIIYETMESRIKTLFDVVKKNKYRKILLGAWGCGVYNNDVKTIAFLFKKIITSYDFEEIKFIINGNQMAIQFLEVFS
jgi:uncharacterized protein (TIGR02452 family)